MGWFRIADVAKVIDIDNSLEGKEIPDPKEMGIYVDVSRSKDPGWHLSPFYP